MKIAILGFAGQGQSAFEYWNTGENEVVVCDANAELTMPNGVQAQLGADYLKNLGQFDLLVRTPALHPRDIVAANPDTPDILDKVWTNTNEFFKVCPSKNIVGVTGTKGKGTTSTLIAKMLEAAGKRVHLGGNIGIPPLELLKDDIQPNDWVVLELANFQLIDLKFSPHIAVCLMVEPEHMDWHPEMSEYITAKQQMFVHQTAEDKAIYFAESVNSQKIASVGNGQKIAYYSETGASIQNNQVVIDGRAISSVGDIKLLGKHNLQNVCAAVTAFWQIVQDGAAVEWVLKTFAGLEHRLELVREFDDVQYYDDSFGTTPETAIVAIEAFEQPKIVILGGSDKGATYEKLAHTVQNHNVRSVIAIGVTGPAIASELKRAGFDAVVNGSETMSEIVDQARAAAQPGDVVLLSTGCASFGLFKNYKDRGEQFHTAVNALA
jgi:UDP-N-acetylmuramoylalanine--D-glutamate ligase